MDQIIRFFSIFGHVKLILHCTDTTRKSYSLSYLFQDIYLYAYVNEATPMWYYVVAIPLHSVYNQQKISHITVGDLNYQST